MKKVISVRFKENGKSYYFDPADADIRTGDYVIVETARGIECGEVVQGVKEIADAAVPKALKPITRMADSVDVRRMRQNREDEKRTVIFYEAPHKLRTTLDDLTAAFGPERSITLCRELTKLHEEIWKTTLGEAVEHYRANDPRGEYVLVMAGAPAGEDADAGLTLEQAAQRALELTGEGFGPTAAAKAAAQGTPYSKSEVYKQLLVLQQDRQTAE